jgi:hypothetical protein
MPNRWLLGKRATNLKLKTSPREEMRKTYGE